MLPCPRDQQKWRLRWGVRRYAQGRVLHLAVRLKRALPLPQDPAERRYEVREQVGKGAFGTVSLVVDRESKKQ